MNAKVIRGVRKLERPRPLKINPESMLKSLNSPPVLESVPLKKTVTGVLNDLENLHISISNDGCNGSTVDDIAKISDILKLSGPELDTLYRDQIDRYFVTLRNISREDNLEKVSRMRLLELIELRAMGWRMNENFSDYYRKKIKEELEAQERNIPPIPPPTMPILPVQQPVISPNLVSLEPGEVLRSSGKFIRPAKIAGKNFFKDEIVIRNSDSGKVMGIKGRRVHMIEELSDTIISFQKVTPGARDRLVQIAGPSEETISRAKLLVEDTIRRNASPIREKTNNIDLENGINENIPYGCLYENLDTSNACFRNRLTHSLSMTDASLGEYIFSVKVGEDIIKVSGENGNIVKIAKSVLDQYFNEQNLEAKYQERGPISPSVHSSSDYALQRADINKLSITKKSDQLIPFNYKETEERSSVSSVCSEDESHKDLPVKNHEKYSICQYLSEEVQSVVTREHDYNPVLQNSRVSLHESGPIKYSREYLLDCSKLPCSQVEPNDFSTIKAVFPLLIRLPEKMFDPEEYVELCGHQSASKYPEEELEEERC